jgi:hypothetical protein
MHSFSTIDHVHVVNNLFCWSSNFKHLCRAFIISLAFDDLHVYCISKLYSDRNLILTWVWCLCNNKLFYDHAEFVYMNWLLHQRIFLLIVNYNFIWLYDYVKAIAPDRAQLYSSYINKGVPKLKKRVSGNPWWQGRSKHHNWSQGSATCYSSKNFPIPLLLLLVPSRKQVYLLFTPTCKKEENPLQFICELVSSSLFVCLMDIAMKQRRMTVSAHKLMPASKVRWLDTEYKGPL